MRRAIVGFLGCDGNYRFSWCAGDNGGAEVEPQIPLSQGEVVVGGGVASEVAQVSRA